MEGARNIHGQDGMGPDGSDRLFLTGAADLVFTTLFNLSFSVTVIEPNHTVIEKVRTLSITAL